MATEARGSQHLNFIEADCDNFIMKKHAEFLKKSKRDYALFGDAIYFNTTFKTNNYNMVCAAIVGVNNHGQSVLFGCGLLDGETTEACKWLFTVFLQAMEGREPETVFTDQAQAIAAATSKVLPNSHHRLCL
ncbi:hypothetical protein Dsin_020119 [Dipteronia sinensis]|uniref:MULE transposase domain-containing protein n=1 Tax=Dipteronia sinensis TaxID=43782 RepID=A0AAE0A9U9_9ROSI|nr:hypothetical protein Dsin_020119 [Dipteronia sinensis]